MREKVLNTNTVPRHKCCSSPFWLYRIYQDTIVNIPEVTAIIQEALHYSRENILQRLYFRQDFAIAGLPAPVTKLFCVEDKDQESGILWGSWDSPWPSYPVKNWDILLNNNGAIYPTKSNETTIRVPGLKPGSEIVWFVRPVLPDGTIGYWGNSKLCAIK